MKHPIIIIICCILIASCSTKDSKTTTEGNKLEVGVQNVNGNIPDTTNAMDMSTHKKDSVRRDTVK